MHKWLKLNSYTWRCLHEWIFLIILIVSFWCHIRILNSAVVPYKFCDPCFCIKTMFVSFSLISQNLSFKFQLSIGKQWKELLDYNDNIGYIFHVSFPFSHVDVYMLVFPRCITPHASNAGWCKEAWSGSQESLYCVADWNSRWLLAVTFVLSGSMWLQRFPSHTKNVKIGSSFIFGV